MFALIMVKLGSDCFKVFATCEGFYDLLFPFLKVYTTCEGIYFLKTIPVVKV